MKNKKIKIFGIIVVSLAIFWIIVNIIPPKKIVQKNAWIKNDKTLISAHRGGSNLNPENTEKAFDYVILETSYVDIVEIDVAYTKDGFIVINHDSDINDMALTEEDKTVRLDEHTYEELRNYNLGRNFIDQKTKTKIYENYTIEQAENAGLTLMTLNDFLIKYQKVRDIKLLLEIKEDGAKGEKLVDEVETMFNSDLYCWWKERTMIISFNDELINYVVEKYPNQYVGPLGYKILPQIIFQKLALGSLYKTDFQNLQITMSKKIGPLNIKLATKGMVKFAHKRNQAVACWTINDEEEMKYLIECGVDIITTDSPDVLAKLLGKI